jgi:putative ABC transport system permease protein
MSSDLAASRLLPRDLLRVGALGLHTRRMRAVLSVLGISIGIAALVAVLGISESSRADLLGQLDRLGTNLLTVEPGTSFTGSDVTVPTQAKARIEHIGPVQEVAQIGDIDGATVRRTSYVDESETGGIAVKAAETNLLGSISGTMADGTFLTAANDRYPSVVLGSVAAERLGIDQVGAEVWLGDRNYTVVGILDKLPLAGDIDRSALIGFPQAKAAFGYGESVDVTKVFVRANPADVADVRDVLAATTDPENASEIDVSRPSDVLEARAAADSTLTGLFLGLGAVALLVGGIGIANIMVISVLERRQEIGLRRALGATTRHIGGQFLTESLILAMLGGVCGVLLGIAATVIYSIAGDSGLIIPASAVFGGLGAALAIGAIAGAYPAIRAAHLSPTDALRSA